MADRYLIQFNYFAAPAGYFGHFNVTLVRVLADGTKIERTVGLNIAPYNDQSPYMEQGQSRLLYRDGSLDGVIQDEQAYKDEKFAHNQGSLRGQLPILNIAL
ncbi:MAG: hypothetical protein ABL904_08185 [Hyphomicrobiaceae bacterium]